MANVYVKLTVMRALWQSTYELKTNIHMHQQRSVYSVVYVTLPAIRFPITDNTR